MMRWCLTGYACVPLASAGEFRPAALIAMVEKGERPMSPASTTGRREHACRSRLSHAPWARLALGDEPGYFAILLIYALVLFPLFDGLWPVFVLTLAGAFLVRAWLWCRGARPEDAAEAHPDKTESPSERKST